MESIIKKLAANVKEFERTDFVTWLNTELEKEFVFYDSVYSLRDVEESKFIHFVSSLVENHHLTISELIEHVSLIASPLKTSAEVDILVEVQPSFFKSLLMSDNIIDIQARVVREKDTFVKSGSFQEVEYIQKGSSSDPIIHAFISLTLNNEQKEKEILNVFFNKEECLEIVSSYSERKYNGQSPFDCKEWELIIISALFERLYTEDVFSYLKNFLSEKTIRKISLVKELSVHKLNQYVPTSNKVFTSRGKLIGHKIKTFNSATNSKCQRPKLSLIQGVVDPKDCQTPVSGNNETDEDSDHYNTWGGF